jgi:hypothetical protein
MLETSVQFSQFSLGHEKAQKAQAKFRFLGKNAGRLLSATKNIRRD